MIPLLAMVIGSFVILLGGTLPAADTPHVAYQATILAFAMVCLLLIVRLFRFQAICRKRNWKLSTIENLFWIPTRVLLWRSLQMVDREEARLTPVYDPLVPDRENLQRLWSTR